MAKVIRPHSAAEEGRLPGAVRPLGLGPYRDFARDMLDSDASRLAQNCSRAKLSSLLSEHVDGRQNHEPILWSLINLEIFLRVFKPEQGEEPAELRRAG